MKNKFKTLVVLLSLCASNGTIAQNKVVVIPLGGAEAKLVKTTISKNYLPSQFDTAFTDQAYFINTGHEARFGNSSMITSLGLSTNLDLPQGAEIKQLTCYVEDNDAAIDFGFASSVAIERRLKTSTVTENVQTADLPMTTSGSTSGLESRTTNSFTQPTIDNDQYFYSMYVFFQVSTNVGGFVTPPFTADIKFRGCSISYDLDVASVVP